MIRGMMRVATGLQRACPSGGGGGDFWESRRN